MPSRLLNANYLRLLRPQNRLDAELERARQRLNRQAVLLRSGVSIPRIEPLLQTEGLGAPASRPAGYASEVWAAINAMRHVAQYAGAPQAWGCESLATAFGDLLLLRKRRRVLLAGPKSSLALIALLPFAALALGHGIGFDPTGVLFSETGLVLLFLGLFLLLTGIWWLAKLVSRAEAAEHLTGFECELLVLALRGGLPLQRARRLVADAICSTNSGWLNTNELADSGEAGKAAALTAASGSGLTQVLLEAAAKQRRHAAEKLESGAEKLGSRVLLPLAVCILPAFVCLGVAPVVISMLGLWGQS